MYQIDSAWNRITSILKRRTKLPSSRNGKKTKLISSNSPYRTGVVVYVELLLPLQLVGKVVVVVGDLAVGAEVQGLERTKE